MPKEAFQSNINASDCNSTLIENQSENADEDEDGPSSRSLEINSTNNIKAKKSAQPLGLPEP
jgi:hypothetical protein